MAASLITQVISSLTNIINRKTQTEAEMVVAGDTTMAELVIILAQINIWKGQANTVATEVNLAAVDAVSASAVAVAAQVLAEAVANATVYVPGTTYAAGVVVLDPGNNYIAYTSQQGSNTGNTPNTDDGTWWTLTIPDITNSMINAADKATPVDADYLGLIDSAASNVLKKLTWANIKATLKTYFDGLYVTAVTWERKTTNFTAVAGGKYKVDIGLTATLPASPSDNDQIWFSPLGDIATTNSTIARNGEKIMDAAADMTWNANAPFSLVYDSTLTDWRFA